MSIFGKSFRDYFHFVRWGLLLLLLMGVVRFAVGVSGVAYDRVTDLLSLTILTFLLAAIYGQRVAARQFGSYQHLIPIAVSLSLTMYGFIILAISVEGLSGIKGYFHSPGSGYAPAEFPLRDHILGQLSVMGIMTVAILGVAILGYVMSRHLAFLFDAFLGLTAIAVVRFFAGLVGVPEGVGTWLTSLTLAGAVVSVYAGYRARSKGLGRIGDVLVLTFLVVFVVTHLIAYGIAVTDGFGIATYFHSPGEMTKKEHMVAHLWFSPWLTLLYLGLASTGFFLAKKSSTDSSFEASAGL